jgi:hypothetical protein
MKRLSLLLTAVLLCGFAAAASACPGQAYNGDGTKLPPKSETS